MSRKTITDAAASGDRLATLEALRARLAQAADDATDGKELAAVALRLQRVLAEIHELGGTVPEEGNDDLASKRAAKLRAAASS